MFKSRLYKGSSLMEYAIPLALVGVVVGLGLYSISSEKGFFNNIIFSSSGNVDQQGGKVSFGSGTSVGGVFKAADGKIYLNNNTGQSIRIPLSFNEKYKDTMSEYLNAGKFDFAQPSLGVETSGSLGIEDIAEARKATTLLYSTLIEVASESTTNPEDKELLKNLSTYGYEIGQIETKLIDIKKDMNAKFMPFELAQKKYENSKEGYKNAQEEYKKKPTSENKENLEKAEAMMQDMASGYSSASAAYKTVSESFLATTQTYFTNLKDKTGVNFDEVLKKIDESKDIAADVKEYVVPVGEKIRAVKDSVDLVDKMVNGFNAEFDEIKDTYTSFNELFKSFDIIIDETAGDETFDLLDQEYLKEKGKP